MMLPTFDTYEHVKYLEAAGFTEQQAAAQVKMQSEFLSSVVDNTVATKQDIAELRSELRSEIADVRTKVEQSKLSLVKWFIGTAAVIAGLLITSQGMLVELVIHQG